jgi:hypothetical protein
MKVEELERYGKTLETIPKKVLKKQLGIMLREIRKKSGLLGIVPFFVKVLREQRTLRKNYPDAYGEALKISKDTAKEVTMLIALFNVVARKDSREDAYEFVKGIFQKLAVYSMPAFYQIDDLVQCKGDPFENFTKFNAAWFAAMQEAGTYEVETNKIENDEQTIIVTRCANCVLGEAFDCPEIAKLGCDHDLAGYPVILDRVNAEFRRPHSMAKGDEYCDFHFYRKGTAPDTEHLNK